MLKKSFLFLFSTLLLISCNKEAEQPDPVVGDDNPYRWNEEIKPSKTISGDELIIAKRICQNFERKRAYLMRNAQGLVMDFRLSKQSCNQSEPDIDRTRGRIKATRSGALSFDSLDPLYPVFDDVLSDEHPSYRPFCESIMAGRETTNTITKGSVKYQISFFRIVDRDWVQLAEFQAPNGTFYPYLVERSSVVTEADGARDEQRGFVSLRAINRPCSNNGTQYTMQEWL